jgi:hypothetical protein
VRRTEHNQLIIRPYYWRTDAPGANRSANFIGALCLVSIAYWRRGTWVRQYIGALMHPAPLLLAQRSTLHAHTASVRKGYCSALSRAKFNRTPDGYTAGRKTRRKRDMSCYGLLSAARHPSSPPFLTSPTSPLPHIARLSHRLRPCYQD